MSQLLCNDGTGIDSQGAPRDGLGAPRCRTEPASPAELGRVTFDADQAITHVRLCMNGQYEGMRSDNIYLRLQDAAGQTLLVVEDVDVCGCTALSGGCMGGSSCAASSAFPSC
eukprot:CAMPEP_0179148242 /NCGR_PEP_ID=MMETSP0796-20121207/71722_1 /TAXON_ID=73915 /ORGANISM="Pyrodinium bahamense, Strain pbaha01" /LENGTH=112 /DNA_ID=CAMNT_0020848933 /DNA_START=29 /DNA_END=364 /DNA_ORIENTATION=-